MLFCAKFVQIVRGTIVEIVRCLRDQKTNKNSRFPLTLSLPRGSRPMSALASPNIWLTTFQISYKSIYFRRSYSRPRDGRSLGPLDKSNTRPKRLTTCIKRICYVMLCIVNYSKNFHLRLAAYPAESRLLHAPAALVGARSIHQLHRVRRDKHCCPTRAGPVPFVKIAPQTSARCPCRQCCGPRATVAPVSQPHDFLEIGNFATFSEFLHIKGRHFPESFSV